jgi:hypothetical protein
MTGYDTWLAGVDYNPNEDYACGDECDCDETEEEASTIDDLPF